MLIGELQVGWSSRAFLGELSPHLVKASDFLRFFGVCV